MAFSSLVLVSITHRQHKQKLVTMDGCAIIIVPIVIVSPIPAFVPLPLGSKLTMNKKQAVHHAKGNSSINSKATTDVTIKSLQAQV